MTSETFIISSMVVKSIVAKRVYMNYTISIDHKETTTDFVKLHKASFEFFLGID